MTRQLNIPKLLPKWPQDWHFHILNTLDLYFDSTKELNFDNAVTMPYAILTNPLEEIIEFSTQPENSEQTAVISSNKQRQKKISKYLENQTLYSIELKLYFSINNYRYIVTISYLEDDKIIVNLYFIDKNLSKFPNLQAIHENHPKADLFVITPVGMGYEEGAWDLATNLEKHIVNDYNKRKNGQEDNDGFKFSPIEPYDPSNDKPIEDVY